MPELPEVETVRGGVERALLGARVREVCLRRADLRWPIPTARVQALTGRTLREVTRRAKYLLLRFSGAEAPTALVHLGMSGRLFVTPRTRAPLPFSLHEHWRMTLGQHHLRYVDPRRFGMLDVLHGGEADAHKLLRTLGPEPLDASFDGAWLHARTRKRTVSTKAFLMDAHNVVGVGNIYAVEALFRAGVRPSRRAGTLSRAACDALAAAVKDTLRAAIAAGGTTIRDYVGADEGEGWFQRELLVYGRGGEACRRCGATVRRTVAGGRATYACPTCQR